jgi:uncharacterized RDD family membrane protein YckC
MQNQAPEPPRPGSLILRAIALALDLIIIVVLAFILIGPDNMRYGVGLAAYLSGWSLYFIGFTMALGATPGKIAMGIHVAGKDGRRPRPDSVILRYVVMLAASLPFGIGTAISIALAITDPKRRALHDRIAGTMVLDGRPPIEEWRRQEERERNLP